jgi:long-subunit acyl-CoA synthetase (AMP-forming)
VEYLEGVYSRSKFVRQIFVYGDSLQPYIVAIVVPNEKYVWSWAEENKIKEKDFPEICRHPALKRKIFDDVAKTGLSQRVRTRPNTPYAKIAMTIILTIPAVVTIV